MANEMERLIVSLEARTKAFENSLIKANTTAQQQLRNIEKKFADTNKKLQIAPAAMGGGLGGLGKIAAAGFAAAGAREVARYADTWTEAGNKIRAASEISGMHGRSLEKLNDIARKTRGGFEETVDLYAKLIRAGGNVAKSEEEIAKATELVNMSFKAGGAAAQEQAAGILQLSQALGSGVLQGDELRSIRENAPVLAQAIADHFKTTIGGLKQLGADGVLTSEEVFKAILAGGKKIQDAFAQTTPTIADGFVAMKREALALVAALDSVSGGSEKARLALSGIVAEINLITEAVKRHEDEGSLDSLLNIFSMKIVEGGLVDQIRDKINGLSDSMKTTADDVAAERDRIVGHIKEIEAQIADFQRSAEENKGSPIIAKGFEESAAEAQADLKALQDELARVERAAVSAGNNGGSALGRMAQAAIDALKNAAAAAAASADPTPAVNGSGAPMAGTGGSRWVRQADGTFRRSAAEAEAALKGVAGSAERASMATDKFGNSLGLTEDAYGDLYDASGNLVDAFGNVAMSAADLAANLEWERNYDRFRDAQIAYNDANPFGPSAELIRDVSGRDVTGMAGFAKGGIAREASIFGEAGPEAAVPLPDGRTIPVTLSGSGSLMAIEVNTSAMVDSLLRLIEIIKTSSGDILSLLRSNQASASASLARAKGDTASGKATGGVGGGIWREPAVKAINTGYGAYVPGKTGYETGGYTGAGGKNQPAGIVHKGEYVFDQEAVRRIGVPSLDVLRGRLKSGSQRSSGGDTTINMGGINIQLPAGADRQQGERAGRAAADEFDRRVRGVMRPRLHG